MKDRMSTPVVTITPDTPFNEAMKVMRKRNVRRLPVVDHKGYLVGIVSERDLLRASPSDANSLDVWELSYLLNKLKINHIMSHPAISITPDTPIVEAARIMIERKIGGLPIAEGQKVVGIITETDIFKAFVELLDARK
ncbi:MAG: CBS domain-containing protein [Ardenticatenaceae bacterium]